VPDSSATKVSFWRDLPMLGMYLVGRLTSDETKRVSRMYSIYPPSPLKVGRRTDYMNLGYWPDGCANLDDASDALADLLARSVGMSAGDRVLDVGFGYGDQDFSWLRDYDPQRIVGLNVTPKQVEAARAKADRLRLSDQLDFRLGSATDMPFSAGSFDRVTALECAFHFPPRTAFFAEAFRVLRPGGTVATVDVLPLGGLPKSAITSEALSWIRHSVPEENWYPSSVYADKLREAGFTDVRVESIRDRVYEPWRLDVLRRITDPSFRKRVGAMYTRVFDRRWANQDALVREMRELDYVVFVARKPE
jgi:cyclopropane fatty-acyl-phospholipid synthase-like methyltransferase